MKNMNGNQTAKIGIKDGVNFPSFHLIQNFKEFKVQAKTRIYCKLHFNL